MKKKLYLQIVFICLLFIAGCQNQTDFENQLTVSHTGDAQIEVGGPYVGIEMHHSSPALQRISFYYPVANSIDLLTDYWRRDTTHVMQLALTIDDNAREFIGSKPMTFDLTPYTVCFHDVNARRSIEVSYHFCKSRPAMAAIYKVTNTSNQDHLFTFETHLEQIVRTCHSYKMKELAHSRFEPDAAAIFTMYDDPSTQHVELFVANAGESPTAYNIAGPVKNDVAAWHPMDQSMEYEKQPRPAARFRYQKKLSPEEDLRIVQIIGQSQTGEASEIVNFLRDRYQQEINAYEKSVLNNAISGSGFKTSDSWLNHSAGWAQAILQTNVHYLDGQMRPMPCPAEYNFYFSHDAFVTDLAAVCFDPQRVKKDLQFSMEHVNADSIIPHAYYWKNGQYITEYADYDNWNNFWFIIVSGKYLRHTADLKFVQQLYPFLKKSLKTALQTKRDGLIWSNRPDWWDIGKNFGPRAYMTILAIKALREFSFISSFLKMNMEYLPEYESLAENMQQQLNQKLWNEDQQYLINYFEDGTMDEHYYIGSLLAAHYGLLDAGKIESMVETAKTVLLDADIGIYNAYPMDFTTLIEYLTFSGNEAGEPYYYFNGGVWSQGNAWYALALIKAGHQNQAFNFIRKTMTVKGIISGPNGQPAMYEVRNANVGQPEVYGRVDKPQFLWAAGWYLYSLYHLFGIAENDWNIVLQPFLPEGQNEIQFTIYVYGNPASVSIHGQGDYLKRIEYNGKYYPSAVIPMELSDIENIEIMLGTPDIPYVKESGSTLVAADFNSKKKKLSVRLKAFSGHRSNVELICPQIPKAAQVSGKDVSDKWMIELKNSVYHISLPFVHVNEIEEIRIDF